jgi:hypothetical protein
MRVRRSDEIITTNHSDVWRIVVAASQGTGSGDEDRIRALLGSFDAEFIPFNRTQKRQGFFDCFRRLRSGGFDLFVFEGTGFSIGMAAILGRILYRRRYVFSSGDAVAPYLSARLPFAKLIFEIYERLLYRCCSGFIGWTPYLVGRALTLGATKAITAAGWAPYACDAEEMRIARIEIRNQLEIPQDAIVFGLVGSLSWSNKYQYCYGAELIRAAGRAKSAPYVLIVGDGSGLPHLKALAGEALGKTILLPGRVGRSDVPRYLAAMDIGSLPQSVDGVGGFRYTTKLSEYRDVGLCFMTNEIPMAYDLDQGDIWRLPGPSPWSEQFLKAMATLMDAMTIEEVETRKRSVTSSNEFDKLRQVDRVTAFINDILRAGRNIVRHDGSVS